MRYSHYLTFGSNKPSEKYYKEHFLTETQFITKKQYKEAERKAKEYIYGIESEEYLLPILISYIVVIED